MADRAFLERLSKELADQGKLIEAGWIGYRHAAMSPAAPAIQLEECKMAFFAGAQYFFHGICSMFDPGEEPTDADVHKLDLLHQELQKFAREIGLEAAKTKGSA